MNGRLKNAKKISEEASDENARKKRCLDFKV